MKVILSLKEVEEILDRAFREDDAIGVRVSKDEAIDFSFKDHEERSIYGFTTTVDITKKEKSDESSL